MLGRPAASATVDGGLPPPLDVTVTFRLFVRIPFPVSAVVMDCEPSVRSVALKVFAPASAAVKVKFVGNVVKGSEELNVTVPK